MGTVVGTATGGRLGYRLGVDLGTTWTAAALARDGRVEMATLGTRGAAVPSVIFVREDESILVGEAASRRGVSEPDRVVREFKRRFGDPTPILVGGTPFAADGLVAKLLRWVVDTVSAREGGPPDAVVVTHPANWGPYKLDLLAQAVRLADVGEAVVISEPEAAAISYAGNERMQVGETIAVYDLGGGTFDAAVLRKTADGFEVLGRPDGIERLGGIDFDEAVFSHVASTLAGTLESIDPDDVSARSAVARLRDDCIDAKEALSSDTHVVIPVILPAVQTEVRLTRSEFEDLIRPALSPTADALSRSLASAGVLMADLRAVLLVGGSSQIPLVGQLLAERLGCPVAIDAHPKHTVAMGAARAGANGAAPLLDATRPPPPPAAAPPPPPPASTPPPPPPLPPPTAGSDHEVGPEAPPVTTTKEARPKRRAVVVVGVVVAVILGWTFVARPLLEGRDNGGGTVPEDATSGPSLTDAEAQQALAFVLAAAQKFYEANGQYPDGYSDGLRFEGEGADEIALDEGLYPSEPGVVKIWVGAASRDEVEGALYLGVQAASETCFYVRADPGGAQPVTAADPACPLGDSAEYTNPWTLP